MSAQTQQSQFVKRFQMARQVNTPLICISTPDPAATMQVISNALPRGPVKVNDLQLQMGTLKWDIVNGVTVLPKEYNPYCYEVAQSAKAAMGDPEMLVDPVNMLKAAAKLPKGCIIFLQNAQCFVNEPAVAQAIWNLRDIFKEDFRTLVLLAPQITLPNSLVNDIREIDEPLPTPKQLESKVVEMYLNADLKEPDAETLEKAVDAVCGLPMFPAESAIAMSLNDKGVDLQELWEHKRKTIEQTPGLTVWRGGETFADMRGCANAIDFTRAIFEGEEPPRCIVLIDEINDAMAGVNGGNDSGVSQDLHASLLKFMQDEKATGILAIGVAGTGKSLTPKAAAGQFKIPLIQFDLAGMKASHVGESEANIRRGLAIVKAISQGRMLFWGTCNSADNLTPQLKSRFNFGTFFYNSCSSSEREAMWKLYTSKFSLTAQQAKRSFDDAQWTGREIHNCCQLAYRLKKTLDEASKFISPVSVTDAEQIRRMREQANRKFISAARSGLFMYDANSPDGEEQVIAKTGRKVSLQSA